MTSDPGQRDPFQPAPATPPGSAAPGADPFARPPTDPSAQPVAPVSAPAKKRGGGAGVLVNALLGVALVVAVGGVAFAVGRATAPASAGVNGNGGGRFGNGGDGGPFFGPNASGAPNGNGGFVGGPGGIVGSGGLSIEGTVTSVSADSVTLQLANGQSVTIPIDSQTTYHNRTAATASDVKAGSTVVVQLDGGRGTFTGNGNGNGNNGNGGPGASGQPTRTLPTARSITLAPTGS